MQQSNALRRVEEILTKAVDTGNRHEQSGLVLLEAMGFENKPHHLVYFYELLNKATEEAKSIKNKSRIDRYIQTIEELQNLFIINHLWQSKWADLANNIKNKNILNTLDALANFFHDQSPTVFLEHDFLDKLNNNLESLLKETIASNLSKELKRFLTQRIEDIIRAIRRYDIDGTDGLEKASKSLLNDLIITDKKIKDNDKKSSIYQRVTSCVMGLVLYFTPTPYDFIGAIPDIHDFWIPKYEEFAEGQKKIEQIVSNKQTAPLLESFEEASQIFDRQPQKVITGKDIKALPPSKQDSEVMTDNDRDKQKLN